MKRFIFNIKFDYYDKLKFVNQRTYKFKTISKLLNHIIEEWLINNGGL